MSDKLVKVEITINGKQEARLVEPRTTLVDFLRDHVQLTGTHVGCEHGICGACSVLLDGEPVRSSCMFAVQVDGMKVTKVEGLAPGRGQLSKIQDAFCEKHAMQCGYCTPGMLIACHALVENNPHPTDGQIREAIGIYKRCVDTNTWPGYSSGVELVGLPSYSQRQHEEEMT